MLKTWQFGLLTGLSALACALVLANMLLFTQNREQQQQVAARQQFIQQSVQLEALYQQIVKNLAELAARGNDEQLGAVLASQGITYTRNPPAAPPALAAPPKK